MAKTSPCPKCRAIGNDRTGNNLVEYDNGFYCFACGYSKPKNYRERLENENAEVQGHNSFDSLSLTKTLPRETMQWLLKYRLTNDEMSDFRWCENRKLLVLYHDEYYWQARNFGDGAKYLSKGVKPVILYSQVDNKDNFVFVEDIVSAIKVGRIATACPMLGGKPLKSTENYLQSFKNVFVWNDKDLIREGLKTARNLSERIGKNVRTIVTENDPKDYNTDEIKNLLTS